ncbi:hemoglobin cathodic subunit beta-like [Polypterus senegalus]
MVHWEDTELNAIATTWGHVNQEEIGHEALVRLLVVYPWTQRYFKKFGNLGNAAAIAGNASVRQHGKTVLGAVDQAVHDLAHVDQHFSALSKLHSDTLHVDPHNFKLLGNCIEIALAQHFPGEITPSVQGAWHKALEVISSALSKRYH